MDGRNLIDLSGRTVIITGCTSGIGLASAKLVAELGARAACFGRDAAKLDALLASLPGDGHRAYTFNAADTVSVESAVVDAVKDMGPLSGVIHSAGVCRAELLRDMSFEALNEMMSVNFTSFMALAKASCRRGRFVAGEMSVVAISSFAALSCDPALSGYAAGKAALNAASASLAREYASRGVRFNTIAPSYVNTRMNDGLKSSIGEEAFAERVKRSMPLGMIEPEDIAECAAFLLSSASRRITGAVLPVTSGGGGFGE